MSHISHTRKLALLVLRVFAPLFAIFLAVPLALAENPAPAGPLHGMAPLPDDRRVPHNMLPPGSQDMDSGPSDVVFPQQQITIRFNHTKHLGKDIGTTCKTCHAGAYKEHVRQRRPRPDGRAASDACHSTDHSGSRAREGGRRGDEEQCSFCHIGYKSGDANVVSALALPRANLLFNHKAHADRNIGCSQCHGTVDQLELATRDQLPRMRGCFNCHQKPDSCPLGGRGQERLRYVPLPG